MGLDYCTYLGPYFACQVQRVTTKETYRACINPECKRYTLVVYDHEVKFCTVCGASIAQWQREVEEDSIDQDEVQERLNEALYTPRGDLARQAMETQGVHIWLNNRRDSDCSWSFDPTEETIMEELDPEGSAKQIMSFLKVFAKEKQVLEEFYGKDHVQVRYGLFSWIY